VSNYTSVPSVCISSALIDLLLLFAGCSCLLLLLVTPVPSCCNDTPTNRLRSLSNFDKAVCTRDMCLHRILSTTVRRCPLVFSTARRTVYRSQLTMSYTRMIPTDKLMSVTVKQVADISLGTPALRGGA